MRAATISITGRLTADPVIRTTQTGQGVSVCNFTVAHTPRRRSESGEWEDAGETLFLRVTAWRALAENCAASLHKGDMVTVTGRPSSSAWKSEDGETRSEVVCNAQTVAVDLSYQTVDVKRVPRAYDPVPDEAWAVTEPAPLRVVASA